MARCARIFPTAFLFVHLFTANIARGEPILVPLAAPFLEVATSGEVTVHFAGSDASLNDLVFLFGPGAQGPLFRNHSARIGDSATLGHFDAGTELVFRLHVVNSGHDFFSGPASRNPDGLVHANASIWSGGSATPRAGVLISFEDLLGGGDRDFNDFQFVVANTNLTETTHTPEPSSLLLVATGVIALGRRAWKRRRHPVE